MTTVAQPLTRAELRDELDVQLKHYATKADLLELKSDLRGDLLRVTLGLGGIQLLGLGAVAAIMRFLG